MASRLYQSQDGRQPSTSPSPSGVKGSTGYLIFIWLSPRPPFFRSFWYCTMTLEFLVCIYVRCMILTVTMRCVIYYSCFYMMGDDIIMLCIYMIYEMMLYVMMHCGYMMYDLCLYMILYHMIYRWMHLIMMDIYDFTFMFMHSICKMYDAYVDAHVVHDLWCYRC